MPRPLAGIPHPSACRPNGVDRAASEAEVGERLAEWSEVDVRGVVMAGAAGDELRCELRVESDENARGIVDGGIDGHAVGGQVRHPWPHDLPTKHTETPLAAAGHDAAMPVSQQPGQGTPAALGVAGIGRDGGVQRPGSGVFAGDQRRGLVEGFGVQHLDAEHGRLLGQTATVATALSDRFRGGRCGAMRDQAKATARR
jgi:hypothetical protein